MRKGLVTINATLSSLIILKGGVNNVDLLFKYTSTLTGKLQKGIKSKTETMIECIHFFFLNQIQVISFVEMINNLWLKTVKRAWCV